MGVLTNIVSGPFSVMLGMILVDRHHQVLVCIDQSHPVNGIRRTRFDHHQSFTMIVGDLG